MNTNPLIESLKRWRKAQTGMDDVESQTEYGPAAEELEIATRKLEFEADKLLGEIETLKKADGHQ